MCNVSLRVFGILFVAAFRKKNHRIQTEKRVHYLRYLFTIADSSLKDKERIYGSSSKLDKE